MRGSESSSRLSVTLDPEVHKSILSAASGEGVSVSAWINAAARLALKRRVGLAAIAEWEEEHGVITPEQLNEAQTRVLARLKTGRTSRRAK